MKSRTLLFSVFLFTIPILTFAQSNLLSSGGEGTGSGTVSYSLGQINYTISEEGSGNSVSEGVQQPLEISVVLDLPDYKDISLAFKAYPNPTTNFVVLSTPNYTDYNLKYSVYDLNGKIIISDKIKQKSTKINLIQLKSAVYMLQISDNIHSLVKVFRIIKN